MTPTRPSSILPARPACGASTPLVVLLLGLLVLVGVVLFLFGQSSAPDQPAEAVEVAVVTIDPAMSIAIEPQQSVSGRPMMPAPAVQLAGPDGQPAVGVEVEASLVEGDFAEGSMTRVTSDGQGLAVFENLLVDRAGAHRLAFGAEGFPSVTSADFVVAFGPPRHMSVVTQPEAGPAGSALLPEPSVRVTDAAGNPVPGINVEVALLQAQDALSGTTRVATDAQGLAAFAGLIVTQPGADHQLRFTARAAGVNEVTSETFALSDQG